MPIGPVPEHVESSRPASNKPLVRLSEPRCARSATATIAAVVSATPRPGSPRLANGSRVPARGLDRALDQLSVGRSAVERLRAQQQTQSSGPALSPSLPRLCCSGDDRIFGPDGAVSRMAQPSRMLSELASVQAGQSGGKLRQP